MSKISVDFDDDKIVIDKRRARKTDEDYFELSLSDFPEDKTAIVTGMIVNRSQDRLKILYEKELNDKYLVVYTGQKNVMVGYGDFESVFKKLIKPVGFSPKAKLSKSKLKISFKGYMYNPYKLNYDDSQIYVCERNFKPINLTGKTKKIRRRQFFMNKAKKVVFNINDLLYENATINCNISIRIRLKNHELLYPVSYGYIKKRGRENYVPFKSKYVGNYAIHLRKSRTGNLVFVRRLKEDIENDMSFKIKESKPISFIMYHVAKIVKRFKKKNVNLFYEKFASKAEEGAYNLFLEASKKDTSESYFVIDSHSKDYERIKDNKNVVPKFSWKYYWLIYLSSNFIATEAPIHINIVRSNNKYFRKSTFEKEFIFLQHGVTYLKCHDVNSPFVNGKEAAPSYICVGSKKERDIVSDMLGLDEEKILVTGLPVFSNIKWESINQSSDDYVTVMLTWKPYEEYLTTFEESTYYQYTIDIFNMLKKYVSEDKIIIIPHPKIAHLMANTDFKSNVWHDDISKALSISKLLITDYSSVCYNSFYQGGGVVFFQPDIDYYEEVNGKLIPRDNEYIGYRSFSINELESICKRGLENGFVDLDYFRTNEFVNRYLKINEFTDGKNLQRICDTLERMKIV